MLCYVSRNFPLDQFTRDPQYSHRTDNGAAVEQMVEALKRDRVQHTPVKYFINDRGQKIPIAGDCRITAMRKLADVGEPGFSHTMDVLAQEVTGADPRELLLLSVTDNTSRTDLTLPDRARTSLRLKQEGCEVKTIAEAFNVGEPTIERDLALAASEKLLKLVDEYQLGFTHAQKLAEAATKKQRMPELEQYLDDNSDKPIDPSTLIKQLDDGVPFSAKVKPGLSAGFDSSSEVITVGGHKVRLKGMDQKQRAQFLTSLRDAEPAALNYFSKTSNIDPEIAKKLGIGDESDPSVPA